MARILEQIRPVFDALWSDEKGWILLFVAAGWSVILGARFIFPVLFPDIRNEFQLSLATLGLLNSLLWVGYAVGQFPSGAIADRYGERSVLVLGTIFSSGTLVIVGLAIDVKLIVAGMVLFGLASSLYGPTRFTVMSDIYPKYDGTAIGITQATGEAGNAVFPFIAGTLAAYLSWRLGFLYLVPMFLIISVGLWMFVPSRTSGSNSAVDTISFETVRSIVARLSTPEIVKFTLIMAFTNFTLQAVTSFYPTYLMEIKGLSAITATSLFSFFFLSAIVVQPLVGAIGDTYSSDRVIFPMLGIFCTALLMIPFAEGFLQLIFVTVLLSSFFGIPPLVIPILTRLLSPEIQGVGLGFLRTCYFLVAATGSVFMGFLAGQGLFNEAFFLLSGLIFVTIFLSVTIHKR